MDFKSFFFSVLQSKGVTDEDLRAIIDKGSVYEVANFIKQHARDITGVEGEGKEIVLDLNDVKQKAKKTQRSFH